MATHASFRRCPDPPSDTCALNITHCTSQEELYSVLPPKFHSASPFTCPNVVTRPSPRWYPKKIPSTRISVAVVKSLNRGTGTAGRSSLAVTVDCSVTSNGAKGFG